MRRSFVPAVLLAFVVVSVTVAGCTRPAVDNEVKPGASVTVTMKDGSVVTGRFVEGRPNEVVVDPFEGGEWKTLPRDQVASIKQTDAGNVTATVPPPAAAAETGQPATPPPGQAMAPQTASPTASAPARRAVPGSQAAASAPATSAPRETEPPAPPAPPRVEFREVTLPANTLVHLRLETPVASDTSHVEDAVRASLSKPIVVDGDTVVASGSEMRGVVTSAKPSGKVKGRASIAFKFDSLSAGGDRYRVQTQAVAREAAGTEKKDAMKVGIPAGAGAVIGGILGGKKGAAIGGAVGGGAGTAAVLTTAGDEVRLPAGTAVSVRLLEPVTVRVPVQR